MSDVSQKESKRLDNFSDMQMDLLWETDGDLNITYILQSRNFGNKIALGTNLHKIIRELDGNPDSWNELTTALAEQAPINAIRVQFFNGDVTIQSEVQLQPVTKDGKFSGYRGILKDISQIVNLENELELAHKHFEILFENNPAYTSITKIENFTYENVNESFLAFHNRDKSDFLGQTSLTVTHWENPDIIKDIAATLLHDETPCEHTSRIADASGMIRSSRSKVVLLPHPDNPRLLVFSSDIRGELAEEELVTKNELLNVILESMLQGVSLLDDNLDLVFCNTRVLELLDFPEELRKPGTKFKDFMRFNAMRGEYGPGNIEELVNERYELAKQFKSHKFDRSRDDGTVLEIEGHYIPNVGFLTTYTDITNRVEAEQEIRENEKLLREIIDSVPFAFSLWNAEMELVLTNSVWSEWFPEFQNLTQIGVNIEDQIRKGLEVGYISAGNEQTESYIARRIADFRNPPDDRMELQEYGNRWLHVINKKLSSGAIVGIRIDVTESHNRDAQLLQAQKMEAVGQLTGGIAHDFNNLLAVILGNAEMLEEEYIRVNHHSSHQISAILRSAIRGSELTQRLLSFSRKFDLSPKLMNLNSIIEELMVLLKSSIGESITIKTEMQDDLWQCFIDPGQMENCLINLCLNARDAMPDGGELIITTKNVRLDNDIFKLEEDAVSGDFVKLSVYDNGEGIPAENLEQVFEPFYTTKEVGKGSGLGLSMVFGFVKQSNGYLSVESQSGKNTTFNLFLPRDHRQDK